MNEIRSSSYEVTNAVKIIFTTEFSSQKSGLGSDVSQLWQNVQIWSTAQILSLIICSNMRNAEIDLYRKFIHCWAHCNFFHFKFKGNWGQGILIITGVPWVQDGVSFGPKMSM